MRLSAIGSIDLFGLKVRTTYKEWAALDRVSPPDLIVDVGVAYGTPILYNRFPGAELLLIEPVPMFHDHIEKNILTRRDGELIRSAAGAAPGAAEITLEKGDPLRSSLLQRSALTKMSQDKEYVEINVDTLDNMLSGRTIPPNALLKIDTEGYELEVLKGAQTRLGEFAYVITEASVLERFEESYRMPDLINHMIAQGFALDAMLAAPVDKRGLIRVADLLFRRL